MTIREEEQIPARFGSVAEAAEFWDTHDLADFADRTSRADFEVDLQRRTFLAAIEPELARRMSSYAQQLGISTETLTNLWLSEKLAAVYAGK